MTEISHDYNMPHQIGHTGIDGCPPLCPARLGATTARFEADVMARSGARDGRWRVGRRVPIHVYEGDTPIGTFLTTADAARAVADHNAALDRQDEPHDLVGASVTYLSAVYRPKMTVEAMWLPEHLWTTADRAEIWAVAAFAGNGQIISHPAWAQTSDYLLAVTDEVGTTVHFEPGSWVIKGHEGRIFGCTAEDFPDNYELVLG